MKGGRQSFLPKQANRIEQKLSNSFWKDPDNKHFKHCGSYSLCCNYSTSVKAAIDDKWMSMAMFQ